MGIEKIASKLPVFKSIGKASSLNASKLSKSIFSKTPKLIKFELKPAKTRAVRSTSGGGATFQQGVKSLTDMMSKKGTIALADDFGLKKQRLIKELSKVCDNNVMSRIERAQSPEQLAKILAEKDNLFFSECYSYLQSGKFINPGKSKDFQRGITLELEQLITRSKTRRADFILAREKAMHVPSKNPQVIAIENILKEQYGAKFVSLKDNEKLAKQVLKAYETAAKNGVKVPKNIIVSDFMLAHGENLLNDTMLLNSSPRVLGKGFCSTSSEFHIPLHEIMHGEQPKLLAFHYKKIPAKYQKVKNELSGYSANSQTHETFTELNTKRLINGLTKEEQELYDYLNLFSK